MNLNKLIFKNAKATNTRMMGVVGLICEWKDTLGREVVQIFHLDYEAYGIDGFYQFVDGNEREITNTILGVTGGLGGTFVEITYDEYVFLIKSAYVVDPSSVESLVDFESFYDDFESLYAGLELEDEIRLYQRLCPEILTPQELLNYFVMRVVGNDYPSTLLLWKDGVIDESFEIAEGAYSLLKNTTLKEVSSEQGQIYRCDALIDFEAHYMLVVLEIIVDETELKIVRAKVVESMEISSIEASFNLNKPEHMLVLSVDDAFFERRFSDRNPEMMKYDYYNGRLYTEFNRNNEHVKENPYYLNGDLYALYFFTGSGQLIIGSLQNDNLLEVDRAFEENGIYDDSLSLICELKTDHPILYSFMNSAYDNIFDFFESWRK